MPASTVAALPTRIEADAMAARLGRVRQALVRSERSVDLTPYGGQADSARNLLRYLAFRRFDLRHEQSRLAQWGLSSLGRAEGHVLHNLDAVLEWLDLVRGGPVARSGAPAAPDPAQGQRVLQHNARTLLGLPRVGRGVRIMVTLPAEAATDARMIRALLRAGMDSVRINCAHDSPAAWRQMISHLRKAQPRRGRRCLIEMDLAGPKIRTGPMRPGPAVLKVRPQRDALGRVTAPASIWLTAAEDGLPSPRPAPTLPVARAWLARRRPGERVTFSDARGARRELRLVEAREGSWRVELAKTAYFVPGLELSAGSGNDHADPTAVGELPAAETRIRLRVGDRLVLTAAAVPGEDAHRDSRGRVRAPAHVACTLPEVIAALRRREPILFDDGHIGGVVESATPRRAVVRITHAAAVGSRLGADKGINVPETRLKLPALTAKDREDLGFVAAQADLVGLSFVHTPADLEQLRAELVRLGRPRMGIVVKVETREGFRELPGILLAALRNPPVGVMIARGDLAVEVGYERLAEVQEEILWLCEAAHLPAIWATQVLEGLAKSGLPTRAEVTDAAMGERAECVMLNKGPHVVDAVRALDSILRRMRSIQTKKTSMLRHLHVADPLGAGPPHPRRRGSNGGPPAHRRTTAATSTRP